MTSLIRPKFHLSPVHGLLNDPNGLAYFNHQVYIFYQYHPDGPVHGLKHWGLFKTTDFLDYEDEGVFLSPHARGDNAGVYSGGGIVREGKLELFYSGNHRDHHGIRKPVIYQVVLDSTDAILSRNCIVDYMEHYTEHQRDPFPFRVKNQNYLLYAVQTVKQQGKILCMAMNNEFNDVVNARELQLNPILDEYYMLECPAMTMINQQFLLLICPQDNQKIENRFSKNIFHSVYVIGNSLDDMDDIPRCIDHGFDFYAPQLFKMENRHIMIPWIGVPDTLYPHEAEEGWSQVLGIPREITIIDNQLYQRPIAEYRGLRTASKDLQPLNACSRSFELELTADHDFSCRIGAEDFIEIALKGGCTGKI